MKFPVYLRIAKTDTRKRYKVAASTDPNNEPLNSGGYGVVWHPTVAFAVNVEIPDELFNQAGRVIAELNVSMREAMVSSEIVLPKGISLKKRK